MVQIIGAQGTRVGALAGALIATLFCNQSQAQVVSWQFPTGPHRANTDNKQFRFLVSGDPGRLVYAQIYTDYTTFKWDGNVQLDSGGSGVVRARLPWFPEDAANHTVDVYVNYWGEPFNPWNYRLLDQGLGTDLNLRYVVLHYLNEGGAFQTALGFSDIDMFDSRGDTVALYNYDELDPLPDAIMAQCPINQAVQYRLLATRNHSVAAGCTRIRTNHPISANNRCTNYPAVFDGIMASDPNRTNALHVFILNSHEEWDTGSSAWGGILGYFPGGTRKWITMGDNISQYISSEVVDHEFGHMAGLPHTDDTTPNDCANSYETRNVMCSFGGRLLVSSQCSAVYNAPVPNLF
jgi:hypothetical protein